MTILSEKTLRDKVLGCWMGKNCGGTLGGPLEKIFSEEEPFNASFYSEVREGGIPNDDLEMQLIWLRAIEEIGLDLTIDDLADYWLDHVAYNFDEYGLTMANLRLGLRPPVAGFYNNFFKDCMGCPIRTEVWACLAPGRPRIAARYAMLDSIVDHAGGESLYGSLFNVTLESAAFVVSDPSRLIEIGLSYLPEASLTARCIRAAEESHRRGDDWLEARRQVLAIGRHPIAQYSPPNIAFQVVGWLYGTDFGDALCKAVNCGYDTDCTGATLGSIIGIIDGAASLPAKWTAPLGDAIATSDPNGVKNLYLPPHPAPRTLGELTERMLRLEQLVTARFGPMNAGDSPLADAETLALVQQSPTRISTRLGARLHLDLDYGTTPQIGGDQEKDISITVRHSYPEEVSAILDVTAPEGWLLRPAHTELTLKPGKSWSGTVSLRAPARHSLTNTAQVIFNLRPLKRPLPPAVPLAVIGAPVWLRSPVLTGDGKSAGELLDQVFPIEIANGPLETENARGTGWEVAEADGNNVAVCLPAFVRGIAYLRGFLHSDTERPVWLHACSTVPAKVWLNGQTVLQSKESRPLRPNYTGTPIKGLHGPIPVRSGWNEILIKFAADATTPSFGCHITYSDQNRFHAGIVDLEWTHFPWDKAD